MRVQCEVECDGEAKGKGAGGGECGSADDDKGNDEAVGALMHPPPITKQKRKLRIIVRKPQSMCEYAFVA